MAHLVVIKWGGSLAEAAQAAVAALARGLMDLAAAGYTALVVHGGGPEITRLSTRLGITARFEGGLRVTDEATLETVIMALAGTVSTGLVADLQLAGVPAVGLSGVDGGLLRAVPDATGRLGLVGEITAVAPGAASALVGAGLVPVVAPLALGPAGPLNVNADLAAAALAGALAAEHLVLLTDVAGVTVGGQLRRRLLVGEIEALVSSGEVRGGMIPKLRACREALAAGARQTHVLAGTAAAGLAAILRAEGPEEQRGTTVELGEGGQAHVA